jgi:wyosine [tRNA(Phe)-imidazoG37] synthetase (radical SAM superfamily)
MTDEPHLTCFSSCLWCNLRFNVRRSYTPGSENEFVDVETFSDEVLEVQEAPTSLVVGTDASPSQASALKDGASPEFNEDL